MTHETAATTANTIAPAQTHIAAGPIPIAPMIAATPNHSATSTTEAMGGNNC